MQRIRKQWSNPTRLQQQGKEGATEKVYIKKGEMWFPERPPWELIIIFLCALRNSQGPDSRFHMLCNQIQNSAGSSDQILKTLSNELVTFQNETVALVEEGLIVVCSEEQSCGFRSRPYLYLRDLWLSTRENYLGGLKKTKLTDKHKYIQNAITDQIQESMGKFDIFRAGKQEVIHNLRGGGV